MCEPSLSVLGFCVDTQVMQTYPSLGGVPRLGETHRQEAGTACEGGGTAWGIVGAEGRHGTWPREPLLKRCL